MIQQFNGDIIQWLRGFYYIAQTGSVRRAAEMMHRNPSTISHELHALEQELNTVLFDRYKKTLKITSQGTKLLDWTISTFETLENMRAAVSSEDGELKGSASFAASLPAAVLAVKPLADFLRAHPKVDISLQRKLPHEIKRAVRESKVDFGLLGVRDMPIEDEMEMLFKARPLLVVHKDNPWRITSRMGYEDLHRIPFITFWDDDRTVDFEAYSSMEQLSGVMQSNSVIKVNNFHLMMRFINHKVGAGIMDEACFQGSAYGAEWDSLQTYAMDHLLPCQTYGILVRRGKHLSPQALALMDVLRKHFSNFSRGLEGEVLREFRQSDEKHAAD